MNDRQVGLGLSHMIGALNGDQFATVHLTGAPDLYLISAFNIAFICVSFKMALYLINNFQIVE